MWTKNFRVIIRCFLYVLIISFVTLFISCQQQSYKKTDDGIIVQLNKENEHDTRLVKLQVVSDKIIHVTATPSDTFPDFTSLVVEDTNFHPVHWDIKSTDNNLTLITSSLKASISLKSGEVVFKDPDDNIILQEIRGGGKSFNPLKGEDEECYHIRQVFESPDDEAFYGLGQHQNGQMNYKGQDVELVQHNIVAVVPFLYSNKNYGILWDNYSITRFGDPREYKPLSSLYLFSKTGEPGGLTAEYYNHGKLIVSRLEEQIDYKYIDCPANWPENVPASNTKVIWEGYFSSDIEGLHKFLFYASDYFKIWIDGELIIDKWRQGWNPWYNRFTVDMKKDKKYSIKLEWITGDGYIGLEHLNPPDPQDQDKLSLFSEVADQIDYYFIYGENADDVISGYRTITGKAPIMPKWAFGLWQSRERYKTQKELLDVVKEYRRRKIPLDNIVLDWQYWQDSTWGSHEFDPERFPDPEGMVKELHDNLNTHIMISVWPKFYKGLEHFEEMQKNGYLFQRNLEMNRTDWIGYISTFYDAFHPDARSLYWKQINDHLNCIGIDAWWLDATEPDMLSNYSIRERKIKMSPNYLGSGAKYFNAYSLLNSKAVYEGSRKANPDKRVFILTRSAFAGQQRYAASTWSGDVAARWSDLKDQIAAGTNFSISGIPYWTHDIGGFSVEPRYENPSDEDKKEWKELMTRWFQFGAFSPLFRIHGQLPYREIYNTACENSPEYNTMVYYDRLRYKLIPYIYTLAGKAYHDDYTIMRPLIMDFPDDRSVYHINDQYMFGSCLLVCPVYEYRANKRKVYLPESCGWYDLYTGDHYDGGQTIDANAPLNKIPVFIKEGSIIPFGPDIRYTGEKPDDPVTLYVYAGKNGYFELYEDEGTNYNYESGMYSIIPISYDEKSNTLTIGDRKGSFPGMLNKRTFHTIVIDKDNPKGIDSSVLFDHTMLYTGKSLSLKIPDF